MRKKLLDDRFYMPTQLDVGTAEKDVTEPAETPIPLAKGSDGLPKFNTLQDNQRKKLPKAMRTQVAFQQSALQYNNLQIVNFRLFAFATGEAQYVDVKFNTATAVGSSLNETVMFSGISGGDNNDALYYNIVYCNVRSPIHTDTTTNFMIQPSFVEFYPMMKIDGGSSAGGKIPTQISNTSYNSGTTITSSGTEWGVQSIGCDVFNEQTLYNQSKDLKGIRCIGVALKSIALNLNASVNRATLELWVEIGIDMKSGGSSY